MFIACGQYSTLCSARVTNWKAKKSDFWTSILSCYSTSLAMLPSAINNCDIIIGQWYKLVASMQAITVLVSIYIYYLSRNSVVFFFYRCNGFDHWPLSRFVVFDNLGSIRCSSKRPANVGHRPPAYCCQNWTAVFWTVLPAWCAKCCTTENARRENAGLKMGLKSRAGNGRAGNGRPGNERLVW